MKNLIILFGLVLSVKAFSATDSDDLLLSGTVQEVTSITVTGNASATSLDIVNGENGTQVASAAEQSNSANGYKIKMHSVNGGFLTNNTNSNVKTSYQINYGSSGYKTPPATGNTVDMITVSGTGQKITNSRNIQVNVSALPNAIAGTYSDTVTFTIEGL